VQTDGSELPHGIGRIGGLGKNGTQPIRWMHSRNAHYDFERFNLDRASKVPSDLPSGTVDNGDGTFTLTWRETSEGEEMNAVPKGYEEVKDESIPAGYERKNPSGYEEVGASTRAPEPSPMSDIMGASPWPVGEVPPPGQFATASRPDNRRGVQRG